VYITIYKFLKWYENMAINIIQTWTLNKITLNHKILKGGLKNLYKTHIACHYSASEVLNIEFKVSEIASSL